MLCHYLLTSVSPAALHKGRSPGAGSELPAWHRGRRKQRFAPRIHVSATRAVPNQHVTAGRAQAVLVLAEAALVGG